MEDPNVVKEDAPTTIEKIERSADENDVNVLGGDNKVAVDIEPDVKSNDVYLQLCSCSLVLNCFAMNSTAKNSD